MVQLTKPGIIMARYTSSIRCIGSIKVWNGIYIPLYEVDALNNTQSVNSFVTAPSFEYVYTSPENSNNEIGLANLSGYLVDLLNNAQKESRLMIDENYFGDYRYKAVNDVKYGTNNSQTATFYTIGFRLRYGSGSSQTIRSLCYGRVALKESSYTSEPEFTILRENDSISEITTWASNGSTDVWCRYNDDGAYKYFRACLFIRYNVAESTEPAMTIQNINNNNASDDIFMGGIPGKIYTLESIGDGNAEIDERPINPYEPNGPSGPSDLPPGTFDNTSDPIPDSSLPTLSAANTGFTRIYNPTLAQVQDLARYLWTDDTVLETIWNKIRQYFENPMDAIIGFNLIPVEVPNGGTKNFALMYIDTGVQMTAAASQFVDQDCGSVKLERYYGSALDQSPYTKVSCFLPYIGTVQLNTDEVMGATLQVKYRVDIVSGSCVAKILVDGNVLYQYSGHCAINIPFSSADFSSYVSAAISVAKLAIGAATAGAAGFAGAGVVEASQQTNQVITTTRTTTETARNPATGRQITTGTRSTVETVERPSSQSGTQASFSGLPPANISNTVGQIMASKPNVEHSGSFSGNTGYLGVRRPFIIIERPNMCLPENYQAMNGFPAMITMSLEKCKGYTRVQQVQLTGMTATNPEQAEILSLLKSGVIF